MSGSKNRTTGCIEPEECCSLCHFYFILYSVDFIRASEEDIEAGGFHVVSEQSSYSDTPPTVARPANCPRSKSRHTCLLMNRRTIRQWIYRELIEKSKQNTDLHVRYMIQEETGIRLRNVKTSTNKRDLADGDFLLLLRGGDEGTGFLTGCRESRRQESSGSQDHPGGMIYISMQQCQDFLFFPPLLPTFFLISLLFCFLFFHFSLLFSHDLSFLLQT